MVQSFNIPLAPYERSYSPVRNGLLMITRSNCAYCLSLNKTNARYTKLSNQESKQTPVPILTHDRTVEGTRNYSFHLKSRFWSTITAKSEWIHRIFYLDS